MWMSELKPCLLIHEGNALTNHRTIDQLTINTVRVSALSAQASRPEARF
jgi:hypothetical protein